MILKPFDVVSRGKLYTFIDRLAIDSDAERGLVEQVLLAQLDLMQDDAKCAALGIKETGKIGNLEFGVYDDSELVGAFLVTTLDYRSGPWADLVDWEITSNDPAVFYARPMPGFIALPLADALDLSIDSINHMMSMTMPTVGGHEVTFNLFSWALYKDRTDANSVAMKRVHDHAAADGRFQMTEAPDPADAARTRVDIELA